jgi:hypothetical protein
VTAAQLLAWLSPNASARTSPERIGFLRRILEETPGGYLEPLPGAWDVPTAGIRHEYEITYFGFSQPTYRRFVMPAGRKYGGHHRYMEHDGGDRGRGG